MAQCVKSGACGSDKTIKVVIYARVSTKAQEYDRQLEELRKYAVQMGYAVAREFSETISGAKKVEERAALTELLVFTETHRVDKVLIYECSRLSRRAVDFLTVIETLTARKISVYIHQNGLETLLPNGTPNPMAQLVLLWTARTRISLRQGDKGQAGTAHKRGGLR